MNRKSILPITIVAAGASVGVGYVVYLLTRAWNVIAIINPGTTRNGFMAQAGEAERPLMLGFWLAIAILVCGIAIYATTSSRRK